MNKKKDYSKNEEFKNWYSQQLKNTDFKSKTKLPIKELLKYDNEIKKEVIKELELLKSLTDKQYQLFHKKSELEVWLPTQSKKDLEFVEKIIWKPIGYSDFRRINPQLIEVSKELEIPSLDIWGNKSFKKLGVTEPYSKHWEILRVLISSATHDGTVGRQLRFLVVDKNTKKYLGIICISSSMYTIKSIHDEIGWNKTEVQKSKNSKLRNIANGQTIVATPIFGSYFLGGKLLSLLCLSKEVEDAWERKYKDKLVGVHTTSLFGSSNTTQYDNLQPYWYKLEQTSSDPKPLSLRPHVYSKMLEWFKIRHPIEYFKFFKEKKNDDGMLKVRDSKNRAIKHCYSLMGLNTQITSVEKPRGVYSSFLYKNAKDFLCKRIDEESLERSFDNSIKSLTNYWRFGTMQDTTKINDEIAKKEKGKERQKKKVRFKSMLKGRIDGSSPEKLMQQIRENNNKTYISLLDLDLNQIKMQYPD